MSTTTTSAAASPSTNRPNGFQNDTRPLTNGNHAHHETRPAPAPPVAAPTGSKKDRKAKKGLDQDEASKLISARISQLESDAAGEKDQEAEIEREVKKANRELNTQTSRMNDMQKIDHLSRRCSDLLSEMKRHERESIKNKKRGDQLQKEKDHSRAELSKIVGLREKLEKLCRELQKENNKLKNENKTLQDTQRRNETSWDDKYATLLQTLEDYQEDKDNPRKLVVDMNLDELFKTRFKSFIDQYELRELHFHSQMRTKELEVQYYQARFDKEKSKSDNEVSRSRQLNTQVQTFSKTETELRQQLNVYVEKFKQVEDTLNNSNDLFLTFRKEMEDMSKKTKRLEKENETLKRKHDKMNQNIFKMAEERTKHMKDVDDSRRNNDKLKSIIAQMQQQGRGIPQGMQGAVESCYDDVSGGAGGDGADGHDNVQQGDILEGEESEYEDDEEYEEGEELSGDEEEYEDEDDETEDDSLLIEQQSQQQRQQQQPQPYGPERPPPPSAAATGGVGAAAAPANNTNTTTHARANANTSGAYTPSPVATAAGMAQTVNGHH